MSNNMFTAGMIIKRSLVGVLLCIIAPYFAVVYIIEHLTISWVHIFMVSGLESLWVYLCWDISKWIKQAWDERDVED